MNGKIVVLPESLSSKIAAGEVIERPASILKELMENALDAGAGDITVELEKGGCGAIKVTDNGEGMERVDVSLAFERFATSKIYEFDDIYRVKSYGFRGEALPSIAAISRVEMITRKHSSISGTRVIVEAGEVKTIIDAGCPPGTSIMVNHIFEPVPVRKKFLKTESTEQGYCMDVITRMALSHPEVRIKVMTRGKEILNIPATGNISDRVSLILGIDFMDNVLTVRGARETITLMGFASKPEFSRSSTKQLYYYVNKRFVRDYLLNHAVMTAYRRLIEAKRYPAAVLFVDLPPEDVDVNVHPAKMEVRFRNPREVYDIIAQSFITVLSNISPISSEGKGPSKIDGYAERVQEALKRYTITSGSGKLHFNKETADFRKFRQESSQDQKSNIEQLLKLPHKSRDEQEDSDKKVRFADLEYIGQIAGTYLAFLSSSGLTLIDQHAAHERVLFDKLKREASGSDQKIISQRLLIPELVSLSPGEFAALNDCSKILENAGMEVEHFGEKTVVVKSVPAMLSHIEPKKLLVEILDEYLKTEQSTNFDERKEKIFALLACKGAIKANQILSVLEVKTLCTELDATPFSSTCPHGRPVFISFSIGDMEKMFKRK
jgi:DNA mismatch repair protein MutL